MVCEPVLPLCLCLDILANIKEAIICIPRQDTWQMGDFSLNISFAGRFVCPSSFQGGCRHKQGTLNQSSTMYLFHRQPVGIQAPLRLHSRRAGNTFTWALFASWARLSVHYQQRASQSKQWVLQNEPALMFANTFSQRSIQLYHFSANQIQGV